MKNKIILTILILSMIALIFSGCEGGGTTPPINHSPTITSLTANPQSPIEINQSTIVTCYANDQDNDQLTYTWTKTGGTISGSGSAITWIAPAIEGTYTITCTVSDGELTDKQSISIDVGQGSTTPEPELIEIASAEINLEEGGVIEVTDPQSELYGLKLIIEPQKNIEKNKDTPITPSTHITIYTALLATCILPEHQGYLITPFIIMSDFADLCGNLIILYTDSQLINSGVGIDESVKVCRVRYPLHRSWEEVSPLIVSKNIVYVSIGLGDILYYYTLTVENAKPPDSSTFKNPKPGDLLYKFSKFPPLLNINEGWLPGHVGIYVGEKYNEEDGKYNVIEALLFGGVQRNYYNPISKFSDSATYMGARQPKSGPLTSGQRDIIVDWAEAMVVLDLPYAWVETFSSMFYSGLGDGDAVKGPYKFNCVGLAEKAYEIAGIDLVSNYDEGNKNDYPFSILTPAEQWYKTVPIPENLAPIISELTAVSSSIDINQVTDVTCSASDPDDDSLAYTWTKSGGTITGSGSTITWTAPSAAGTYAITCTVSDGNGGEDSESVNIIVKLNDEKEIENIINKIISAISIWDWNEARSYCVYNSPTYYDICELEEQYYNGVLGINYFVDINNIIIIINNGYAEVYGDITIIEIINGIISNEQTFNIIGYFQKIGNNWKIYETIPGYNPITYFFKTLRMLA